MKSVTDVPTQVAKTPPTVAEQVVPVRMMSEGIVTLIHPLGEAGK